MNFFSPPIFLFPAPALKDLIALECVFCGSFLGLGDRRLSQKLSSVGFVHQRNMSLP